PCSVTSRRPTGAQRSIAPSRWPWSAEVVRASEHACRCRCRTDRSPSIWCRRYSTIRKERGSMPDLARREGSLDHFAVPCAVAAAALVVLPDAAKLVFRGRPSSIEAAGKAFGVALPQQACRSAAQGNRTAYWLGP